MTISKGLPTHHILNKFLQNSDIDLNLDIYLSKLNLIGNQTPSNENIDLQKIKRIIAHGKKAVSEEIKLIDKELYSSKGIRIGRVQKNLLIKVLLYKSSKDISNLITSIDGMDIEELNSIILKHQNQIDKKIEENVNQFLDTLRTAIQLDKRDKIKDYILFLYSRIYNINENKSISLWDIYRHNENYFEKELDKNQINSLREFCIDTNEEKRENVVKLFNHKYQMLLDQKYPTEKYGLTYIEINQELFDGIGNKNDFWNFIFTTIKQVYYELKNHRIFAIHIKDVMNQDVNLKWEISSLITIFSSNLIKIPGNKNYYNPASICVDYLEHKIGRLISSSEKKQIKNYFKSMDDLKNDFKQFKDEIESFKEIETGFSYLDLIVLSDENPRNQSKEINFIENKYDLLLLFTKNHEDMRKIPCPVCGSLKISGNSYSEVGIKSWECKDEFCAERSKSNRGKRYSLKSNFMQESIKNVESDNMVPRRLMGLFRRDITYSTNSKDIYNMIVKYFSYKNDEIALISSSENKTFQNIIIENNRIYKNLKLQDNDHSNIYNQFIKSSKFIQRSFNSRNIISKGKRNKNDFEMKTYDTKNCKGKIIHGNSLEFLRSLEKDSIDHMVTSPPYYNAREYSQWLNIYNYLHDMYQIILEAYRTMKPGGVFFYNIGDVYGNENKIVKSTMGEQRIPLGAYLIYTFREAGFEILDNIIWDKGETQTNRHKSDGNFTPFYVKPANCYEHMFIFKKPGPLRINKETSEIKISENIIKFPPVIKISSNGKNKVGHTAPFPLEIPLLSGTTFTNGNEKMLDPFLGAGTTAMAAIEISRNFIGIEIMKKYFNLSCNNVEKAIFERKNSVKDETLENFLEYD